MRRIIRGTINLLAVLAILVSVTIACYLPYLVINPIYMVHQFERLASLQHDIGEGADACMNADLALHWSYKTFSDDDAKRLKIMKDDYCMEINE